MVRIAVVCLILLVNVFSTNAIDFLALPNGLRAWIGKIINPHPSAGGTNISFIERQGASDMLPDKPLNTRTRGLNTVDKRWPGGIVPYVIDVKYDILEIKDADAIRKAMDSFEKHTCIRFREKTAEDKNYVRFYRNSSEQVCQSHIGMQGGEQLISIGKGCAFVGIVMHEVMHALSWKHEHNRKDRDGFVNILWDNIKAGKTTQFLMDEKPSRPYTTPYCYGSIMHYGLGDFRAQSWNPLQKTMKTVAEVPKGVKVGQIDGLNQCDILAIRRYYQCDVKDSKPPGSLCDAKDGKTIHEDGYAYKCDEKGSLKPYACVEEDDTEVPVGDLVVIGGLRYECALKEDNSGKLFPRELCFSSDGRHSYKHEQQFQNGQFFQRCVVHADSSTELVYSGCATANGTFVAFNENWMVLNVQGTGFEFMCLKVRRSPQAMKRRCVYKHEPITSSCYRKLNNHFVACPSYVLNSRNATVEISTDEPKTDSGGSTLRHCDENGRRIYNNV